ncbi:MAG TPA: fumarylacetoacetate hydrolase family protein [Acidimicrobiales bacterium]|nr:fumarylacetoacetate hydrolase family protein [Acidimicrobiales bacterium]
MRVSSYGVTRTTGCVGRVGDHVVDLARALDDPVFAEPALNAFMAAGPTAWREAYNRLADMEPREELLTPLAEVTLVLPWRPADYVDFYASESHATNLGRMFRPDSEPLLPNWRHLPVGYHGRAATLVVSGEPVYRPQGLTVRPGDERPTLRPTAMLDVEVELGVIVGVGSERGHPVPTEQAWDHIFGFVVVNDWSARDIQSFEYQPLGPHLGKSFATSVSAWVTPAAAVPLVEGPPQDVDPYLRVDGPRVPDLDLALELNGTVVSRTNARELTWGPAQLVANATVNGAAMRTGDLYASGTISGWEPDSFGSLIELTWRGERPLTLDDGSTRTFLQDGDVATIRSSIGEVSGRVEPLPEAAGWRPSR